jgi:hypothetical protein
MSLAASAVGATTAPAAADSTTAQPTYALGTVNQGTELNCLVLVSPWGASYVLLGGDPATVHPGASLLVYGNVDTSTRTTCGQGPPLQVISTWNI